jgi:hypothetical protein
VRVLVGWLAIVDQRRHAATAPACCRWRQTSMPSQLLLLPGGWVMCVLLWLLLQLQLLLLSPPSGARPPSSRQQDAAAKLADERQRLMMRGWPSESSEAATPSYAREEPRSTQQLGDRTLTSVVWS